jgi:pimeloyl-ACP methyl ester carboxylesterase
MNERVVEFGPGNRLVGILTAPAPSATVRSGLAVVFTNSGIIHRVGANRLHVRLARHLAKRGFTCLRYDLPGVGDSDLIGSGPVPEQKLVATKAALDRLQSMGVAERFVMVGLCSGADHSLAVIASEPRVIAALLIDPTVIFSTRLHEIIRVLRRFRRGLRPSVVWRILTGRKKLDLRGEVTVEEARSRGLPHPPPPDRFAEIRAQSVAALTGVVQRGAKLFFLLTGHTGEAISYRGQIADAFPEITDLPRILRVEIRPAADHTFSREVDRRFLEAQLTEWLEGTVMPDLAPLATDPAPATL